MVRIDTINGDCLDGYSLHHGASMTVKDELHLPQFATGAACQAAGISTDTFKNWVSRKPQVILLSKDEREEAGGRVFFKLTLQSVYHLALLRTLAARGLEPRHAHMVASAFTLFGDGTHDPEADPRGPACLYADGYTYLIGTADGGYTVQVDPAKTSLVGALVRAEDFGGASAVVRVDPIVWAVRAALGLPQRPGQA